MFVNQSREPLKPPAGIGIEAGVHKMDLPLRLVALVDTHLAGCEVNGHIVVERMEVQKVILDDLAPVPEGNDELSDIMGCEDVHDVPENRASADLDHRLGSQDGFL